MMEFVNNLRLAKVVIDRARLISNVIGDRGPRRGVLSVARDVARSWIRDAYLAGYRDGIEDMIRVHDGMIDDPADLQRQISIAARRRDELERAASDGATP